MNKSRERKSTETILQNRINDLFKRAEAEPNTKLPFCEIQNIRLRLKKINIRQKEHLILDIMSYTDNKNVPGVVLFIDFRKAFDTIMNGISSSTPLKS